MKVNSDFEQLNINAPAVNANRVLYASQAALVNHPKDYFHKVDASAPVKSNSVNAPVHYFSNNPKLLLKTYLNPVAIDNMVNANPKIKEILSENGIEYSINTKNLSNIVNTHLTTTTAYALQMAKNLNLSLYDRQILELASVFHDFGKVLIPSEILNKPGVLSSEEKQVMDLHSDLGYELLSKTGLNKRALELIKNHHNPSEDDLLAQILSVADMYSALREVRCYKKPLSNMQALEILDQKAKNGEVSAEVVAALKSSVPSELCAV